jgi:hypothetical protein
MKNLYIVFIIISIFYLYSCNDDKINKVQSDEIEWIGPLNPDGASTIFDLTSNENGSIFYTNLDSKIYKSSDMGLSWFESNYPNTEFNGAWIMGSNFSGIYFFTLYKVFFSEDDGLNWYLKQEGNMNDFCPFSIAPDGSVFTQVYDSIQQSYVFQKSIDNCNTLQKIQKPSQSLTIISITFSDNKIFILTNNGGIYSSETNIINWELIKSNIEIDHSSIKYIKGYIFIDFYEKMMQKIDTSGKNYDMKFLYTTDILGLEGINNNLFIISSDGMYRSMDLGSTWEKVTCDILPQHIHLTNEGYLFIADQNKIYRSKNKIK